MNVNFIESEKVYN